MADVSPLRSVSFDTSFLLKENILVDKAIKTLERDAISCFITSTVASELEQLKVWGRITPSEYSTALKRWRRSHATVIDFKNRLFADTFGKSCVRSMEKHLGVQAGDIVNDCSILISTLKNGVDVFLSEDYHFTSAITREVIDEVTNAACTEYHQMCDAQLYCIDTVTFLEAYHHGGIDMDVIRSKMKPIRKSGKRLGE